MQIPRDAGALVGQCPLLFEFQHPMLQTDAVGMGSQGHADHAEGAQEIKWPGFPKMRRYRKSKHVAGFVPITVIVASLDMKDVRPWSQSRVKCHAAIVIIQTPA